MRFPAAWIAGSAVLSLIAGCGGNGGPGVTVGPKVSAPTRSPELALTRIVTGNHVRHDIIAATAKGSEVGVLRGDSTHGSLIVSSPAWSPDGRRIAFAGTRGLTGFAGDIYLMHADGSSVERLSDDGQSLDPVWAPDGKTIAFARWTPGQSANQGPIGSTVWTMAADGSNLQQLTDEQDHTYDQPGSFSPDGATLAFTRYISPFGNAAQGSIYALNLRSFDTRELADDGVDPAYSPDGTRVAFGSSRDENGDYQFGEDEVGPSYELYLMDANGSNRRRLSETEGVNEVAPSWSSDGAELAYEWQGDGFQKVVYVMNPNGSCAKAILDGGGRTWYSEPAWRPGSRPGALHCSGPRGATATRACRRADYRLLTPQLNGATGAIVSGAAVRSRRRTPCRLHTVLRFAVRRRDGALVRQIRGNPARVAVEVRLAPEAVVGRGWSWRNWCGAHGAPDVPRPPRVDRRPYHFRFAASAGGQAAAVGTSPPRCDSRSAPSTLRRFGPHRVP